MSEKNELKQQVEDLGKRNKTILMLHSQLTALSSDLAGMASQRPDEKASNFKITSIAEILGSTHTILENMESNPFDKVPIKQGQEYGYKDLCLVINQYKSVIWSMIEKTEKEEK